MTETSIKKNQLRKDLFVILVLALIIFGVLAVLIALNNSQEIIVEWSSSFYQTLLRL